MFWKWWLLAIINAVAILRFAQVGASGTFAAPDPPFDIPTTGYVGHWVYKSDNGNHWGADIWTNTDGSPTHTRGNPVYVAFDGTVVAISQGIKITPEGIEVRDGVNQLVIIQHDIPAYYAGSLPDIPGYNKLKVRTFYFHMANEYTGESYVNGDLRYNLPVGPGTPFGSFLGNQGNRLFRHPPPPHYAIRTHLHVSVVPTPFGKETGNAIDPSPYFGLALRHWDRVPLWFPVTAVAEAVPVVVQGPVEDVGFRPNYGVPTYVSPSSKAPSIWELFIEVVRKRFEWLPQIWTKIKLSIPVLFQSPVYVTWDQYDRAHALQMAFMIQGTDGADRLLVYSANAPNHWYRAGWVDMGPRGSVYDQWETFSRDLDADYRAEYGVPPYLVKELWVGHFIYGGFEGNQGGMVQNIYLQGCSIPAGAGSSRQFLFQQAYHRVGGVRPFRCPAEYANWWVGLVRQELQGAPQVGVSALLHDEPAEFYSNDFGGVPAYMVQGGFWTSFYKITGPFLGAPASDHYINAFGRPQTDFRHGFAWWDGSQAIWRRPLLKGSGPEVYLIERGWKRWVPTEETLFALGYSWADLQVVSDSELNLYPRGADIPDVGANWLSQYYDNRLWLRPSKVTRAEGEINFDWGFGSPDPLVPADNFSAVFSRYLDFTGGEYELTLNLDDSVWLYLDGNLIFSRGCCGPSTHTLTFPAGRHLMQIRYRAYTWTDYLSLSFKPLDAVPPVADIGGPYIANEGETLTFDASASYDPEPGTGIAKIEWDLDQDGEFDDAVGFTASEAFGDDFEKTISIQVTDGAGNSSIDSTTVTIENVPPTVTLDKSNVTSFFGGNAFVATLDDLISFPLRVTDPGSDDVVIFTNFGDGNAQADTFFNDPNLGFDPFPSIDIHPRDINLSKLHQYQIPNIFTLTITATDDDGGVAEDTLLVLITDNKVEIRTQGFWKNQYGEDLGGGVQYPEDFLLGFWEVGKFVSKVFDEVASASNLSEIEEILSKDGEGNPMIDRAQSQCLSTLLNFSSGSVKWNSMVDTDFDGIADVTFNQAITQAEDLIADPESTDLELEQAKDICDSINNMETLASSGFSFAWLISIPALLVLARILVRLISI